MHRFPGNPKTRGGWYLFLITAAAFVISYLMAGMLVFTPETFFFTAFWLFGFTFLAFNLVYMLAASVCSILLKDRPLPEAREAPSRRVAVIYPVKNEGEGLYERIRYSMNSASEAKPDFWLLSDSDPDFLDYEVETVRKLRREFGETRISYRHRAEPREKKQGNIMEWLHQHHEYEFFFVCDADTMMAPGTLPKLLRKAAHPEAADIAIFQSRLEIVHAKTYFAKFQAVSSRLAQKLYVRVNQAIFARQVSFGHGCLVRAEAFRQLRLPKGIWSHDIWDMALLDQMGWRTVFCSDTVTYDEVPSHYLELKSRNRRWARGTLQSWPLLFLPRVSLASRFYVFYGIYMYVAQPVFFFWLLASFWAASSFSGFVIEFQRYAFLGGTLVDIELTGMMIFSLGIVFLHKLAVCRSLEDLGDAVFEILFSTLICLNNVLYQTVDILVIPFQTAGWIPMKKDPFADVTALNCVRSLWPGTLLGLAGAYFGFLESPEWAMGALPFLVSFTFSIPLTYLTAKQAPPVRESRNYEFIRPVIQNA